jgi:hypothetical protein
MPGDAGAGEYMAIEEDHGIKYHSMGSKEYIWIFYVRAVVLGTSEICLISSSLSGSRWFGNFRLTNSGQIHLNLSYSSSPSKILKTIGSR